MRGNTAITMLAAMPALMDIIWVVLALCLIGTVVWAFQTFITIPPPFAWVKGILTFLIIAVACWFVWQNFVAGHFHHVLR